MTRLASVFAVLYLIVSVSAQEPASEKLPDKAALAATEKDEKDLASLAKHLAKAGKSEKDKARAIYRWITDRIAYDVEGFLSGKIGDQKADAVLRTRSAVCEGYANLFVDLSTRAGLKSAKVVGFAKGIDYKPGQKIARSNHAWNAVQVGGKWHLLDSTWGAGSVNGKNFEKRFSEFYFFTDPEKLVFTHLPTEAGWQLLKKPVAMKDFEEWPYIAPALMRLGPAAKDLREAVKQKGEFPKAYSFPGSSTSVVEVPLNKLLKAGKEYTFKIRSGDFAKIVLLGKDNRPQEFEKDGDLFTRKMTPSTVGPLRVGGQMAGELLVHGILEYAISE